MEIDLPIFHHPTQSDIVRFFSDVSDAIDIGIVLYNTCGSLRPPSLPRASGPGWPTPSTWSPSSGTVPPDCDYDEMRQFAAQINVIDNANRAVRPHRNGGQGYINNTMHAYPAA